jgi:hypothetical protein
MVRSSFLSLLLLATASCAAAGDPSTSPPREEVTRSTTVITTAGPGGATVQIPVTTTNYGGAREFQIAADADAAFAAIAGVYQDLGMTVGTIDGPNRTTGNSQIRVRGRLGRLPVSTFLDCGQTGLRGPAADAFPVRLSVLSTVVPDGQESRLRTRVEGAYTAAEASGTVACTSTGELEAMIGRAVQGRVARG